MRQKSTFKMASVRFPLKPRSAVALLSVAWVGRHGICEVENAILIVFNALPGRSTSFSHNVFRPLMQADAQFLQRPTESSNDVDVLTDPPKPTSTWLGIRLRANKKLFGRRDWLEVICEAQVSVLPPLQRVALVRLWQPTAVPDTAPTVVSIGRTHDRLAQRSSPIKSGQFKEQL